MKGIGACCAVILLAFLVAGRTHAATACEPLLGRIVSAEGAVSVQRRGQVAWQPVALEEPICAGDAVRVGSVGRAGVWMDNETVIRLDSGTTLTFLDPPETSDGVLDLLRGAVHFLSRVSRSLQIKTPFVNAGIKGTELNIQSDPAGTRVTVFEGRVEVDNAGGMLTLVNGESAFASPGNPPGRLVLGNPRETANWAVYYPPIVDLRPGAPSGVDPAAKSAIADYRAGRVDRAIERLGGIPATQLQPQSLMLRASLLLSVGRVEDAEADLDRLDALKPNDGVAGALRSIIALAQGRSDEALNLAQAATRQAPTSSVPWVALSYARQARFDHPSALTAAQEAVTVDPDNALAHARVAELHLALGQRRNAQTAAERALQLNPELARTQSVFGFANLAALAASQAEASFEEAIRLNPADPLPRLGIGLARIRQGRLVDGRQQIEIAAGLDPANSLIRSYLGKAYFSERRAGVAAVEFANAKSLDPRDPTPWFYDGLRRLADNDPIGALQDLEQSLVLNDNRATTRSSLLLDEDRGARTADQGQVFRELGFERLIPGITARSLMADPGSPGVHRLQASANRPRRQSSRVSELLQWQLNAPLTSNLLPIQQTEADLSITSAAELLAPSEAEWSQMFSADGPFLRFGAVGGSKDLLSNDLTLGYQTGPVVLGLGQFHYEFDGYARNNDQNRDIYGASVQWQASPSSIVFAEYRDDDRDFGDLSLGFGPEDVAPDFRTSIDSDRWRLSARHGVRPDTQLLATVAGFDSTEHQTDRVFVPAVPSFPLPTTNRIRAKADDDGWMGELQLIQRWTPGALVAGAGYYDSDSLLETITVSDIEIPGVGDVTINRDYNRDDTNTRHKNAYAYWSGTARTSLNYTLGLAYDDYSGPELDRDQLSPKLGLMWHLTEAVELRAVAARGLKRALVAEQTVEPTQLAGFTQMFDDANGTDARLYGIAMDTRFGTDIFLGAELRARNLTVPYTDVDGDDQRTDWDERNAALYGYWTPTERLALRAEFLYEDLTYDDDLPHPDKPWSTLSLDTKQVPISFFYFSPRGYTARLTGRWIDQDAELVNLTDPAQPRRFESDSFWTVDLEVDYRFPKHYGRIAIGARNLFDKDFGYQEPDLNHPTLARERTIYLRVNLAL